MINSSLFCPCTPKTNKRLWNDLGRLIENEYVLCMSVCSRSLSHLPSFSGRRAQPLRDEALLFGGPERQARPASSRGVPSSAKVWRVKGSGKGLPKEEEGAREEKGHVRSDLGGSKASGCMANLPWPCLAFYLYRAPTPVPVGVSLHGAFTVFSN